MPINPAMIPFYMEGRQARLSKIRRFVDHPDDIAEKILDADFRAIRSSLTTACNDAGRQISEDRKLRDKWMAEQQDQLASLVGASEREDAWRAYCQGWADELAYSMEPDVLDALEDDDDDDDEDGDDDDDDDDKDEDTSRSRPSKS